MSACPGEHGRVVHVYVGSTWGLRGEGGHGWEGAGGKAGLRSRAAVMVLPAEPPPLPSSYLVMYGSEIIFNVN